ncbi:Metalloenzyme, LuxS/M16 peptidase-like protein [Lentinula raphanica]|uniref:Metalloenzyme, LuxS/M16 peptidase-like protein n=1 Tax=Lentinula raphanica TaxID=153919 RepID=A0AA38P806_9AGAR|nr:Metalloenzyme, LuxS/M16 peptidase-like protein [Lentinula raphanica]
MLLLSSRLSASLLRLAHHIRYSPFHSLRTAGMAIDTTPWRRVTSSQEGIPPYSVFTKLIQKSPQDDREYRIIELENGLKAVLIHDAKADKAAASLDVAVGHLSDPDDMPGLAHFCEHLLFMGTEQFPKENEYQEYLSKNNGGSNAYTAASNTNYYFSVATSALPGALARFSGFFHSPLFSPSCTSRELNAVDSEHKKNHQQDLWRIFQLTKYLSKPGHVWSKFGTGNRESLTQAAKDLKAKGKLVAENGNATSASTLGVNPSPIPSRISSPAPSVSSTSSESDADGGAVGRETRRRLVEWWNREYCASRMHLAILGQESLDELADLASKYFSPIPNRQVDPLPMIYDHPFGPAQKGTMLSVQTIMTFHALDIYIPIDYQAVYWRHKPANLLAHLIGHEGPGSLYSYLKSKGWVAALNSGPSPLGRGFDTFRITIELTEDGFKNYRSVILTTFKYFSLLRSSEFEAYHQRESAILSDIRFRFLEKRKPDRYVSAIAERMTNPYPWELLLAASSLTWEWGNDYPGALSADKKKVDEMLEQFKLQNGMVVLMAKEPELEQVLELKKQDVWEKEPWYGTPYRFERFDEEFLRQTEAPNDLPELFLPGPNEFIPTNLDVDKRDHVEPVKRPHLIRETSLSSLWHKKDDRFWVPKAHVMIDIRSPISNSTPRAAVLTRLFTDLVTDSLEEFSYNAALASLSYSCTSHTKGMYVTLQGYNDKMSVLVQHVLDKVKSLEVRPNRLRVIVEQSKHSWENFFLEQSYQLSEYYGRYLMTQEQWTLDEYLKELAVEITPDEVERHAKKMLLDAKLRILVSGNIYKEEAVKMAEIAEAGLSASAVSQNDLNDRALILPQGCNLIKTETIPNPNQTNSSLTYYVRIGSIKDSRLRVAGAVLTQILTEPAFNVLRTREQLGYVVFCGLWSLPGSAEKGIRIVVQSEKTPGYLETRVEAFLEEMKGNIEAMTPEMFEEHKSSLDKKWREEEKNLSEEFNVFAAHIHSGHLDFYRKITDANILKDITKDEIYSLFMSHVHPSSKTRSKLSVQMRAQRVRPKRVSAVAAETFEARVREAGVEITAGAWKESISDETPTIEDFQKYWTGVLTSEDRNKELIESIVKLVEDHPVDGEGPDIPRSDARYIGDMKEFRASLQPSEDLGAMVEWGDLPVSKL